MIFQPFSHLHTGCTAYLFRSGQLRERLSHMPMSSLGWTAVRPAHLAGSACGAGMIGKPVTAIALEKLRNPGLGLGREDFNQGLAS